MLAAVIVQAENNSQQPDPSAMKEPPSYITTVYGSEDPERIPMRAALWLYYATVLHYADESPEKAGQILSADFGLPASLHEAMIEHGRWMRVDSVELFYNYMREVCARRAEISTTDSLVAEIVKFDEAQLARDDIHLHKLRETIGSVYTERLMDHLRFKVRPAMTYSSVDDARRFSSMEEVEEFLDAVCTAVKKNDGQNETGGVGK